MFSIGEFSKITSLTVKTLRFYHERGLLVPAMVDAGSGYRYYDNACVEKAHAIVALRNLEFSLEDIGQILQGFDQDDQLLDFLVQRRTAVKKEITRQRDLATTLDQIIHNEQESRKFMAATSPEVIIKSVDTTLVAGIRIQGRYSECGKGFATIGKAAGRFIAGKPLCLFYDKEYREEDADFEACFPVRKAFKSDSLSVRELPGGQCLSLIHVGPYEEIGRSYQRLLDHANEQELTITVPSREVYLKGPGMIFKGNPKKYVTELQMFIA